MFQKTLSLVCWWFLISSTLETPAFIILLVERNKISIFVLIEENQMGGTTSETELKAKKKNIVDTARAIYFHI